MKALMVLLAIILLFTGGSAVTGIKKRSRHASPEAHLEASADSLQSAAKQLEAAALKLDNQSP